MTTAESRERPVRSGSAFAIVFVAVVALVAAYFALGMPGMDHSGGEVTALSPKEFGERLRDPEAFVVNVHVPDEGGIDGTDAEIPYDRIVGDGRLPGHGTQLLLYCKTGRMSEIAGRDLVREGYTRVAHLAGGMEGWKRAGFDLARG